MYRSTLFNECWLPVHRRLWLSARTPGFWRIQRRRSQAHFICLDGEKHEVVQILRTRLKKHLLRYFGKFTPQARDNVKTVTMDLNFYYQDIVRACLPKAQIVIDRFHMAQMLTRSLNSFRVSTMKRFDKRSRQYQLLKSPWNSILKTTKTWTRYIRITIGTTRIILLKSRS